MFYLHFIGEDKIFFFQWFFFALNKMILVKTALSILFAKLSCLKRSYNFNHFFFWLVFSFSFLRRKGKRFCSTNCDYFDTFFGSVFFIQTPFFLKLKESTHFCSWEYCDPIFWLAVVIHNKGGVMSWWGIRNKKGDWGAKKHSNSNTTLN